MEEPSLATRPVINAAEIQKGLLNTMCSKSGECVSFGRYVDVINSFFENMSFTYLVSPIKRIGSPSANGFVNELIFQRENYKNYCVLKSSAKRDSDNLAYEYYVGKQFINQYVKKLPCFLETYKIYQYSNIEVYYKLKDKKKMMQT